MTTPSGLPRLSLRVLDDDVDKARATLNAAIRERIPVGSWVTVRLGGGEYDAHVLKHSTHDWSDHRVKVRGDASGKEHWVYATRLKEYDEL